RSSPNHLELGPFGAPASEQIQHHICGEPRCPDTESGETGRVGDPLAHCDPVERTEPGASVDDPSPPMSEPQTLQLRKRLEKVPAQHFERCRPLLTFLAHSAREGV